MNRTALHWWKPTLVAVMTAVLSSACADEATLGPDPGLPAPARLAALPAAAGPGAVAARPAASTGRRTPDLGACDNVRVPAGSKLVFRVYASGVQIYHWNGGSWSFSGPSAQLFADAGGHGLVGTHYNGPIWESASGGTVTGFVLQSCTPDPDADT